MNSSRNIIEGYTTVRSKSYFIKITEHVLDNTYFQYEDKYYKQIEGVSMGSPCSPSIWNMLMDYLINKTLEYNKKVSRIHWIRYYVDDTLLIVHKDDIDKILLLFNRMHHKIH